MQTYKKIFGFSAFCLSSSIIFAFFAKMKILEFGIRDQTALRSRNEVKGFYLKLPIPLDFRVYFFNVTNPMEVQKGQTPILKEIGPYCYDEWKEKHDVIENDSEDSLTYSAFDHFFFNDTRSAPNSDEDYVTILNPLLVGMVNAVAKDSPALLGILNKAITSIFRDPESIYLTVKVKDLLFDGMVINCTVKEFSAKAVCSQLKAQIPDMKEPEKNIFLFSLLGSRNATLGKRVKVLRGIKKSKDLGRVVEYDGKKQLDIWGTKECNRYRGTDGWIFPPLMDKEEGIWSFSTDLCRNVGAEFAEPNNFKGVPVNKFYATIGDQAGNPEEKCYCPTPKTCMKKGVFDLTKCMGVPIYASLPHFLEADPILLQQVRGLKPDKESHIVRINFEQMSGTPVEARKRMQFNLAITSVNKISLMKTLPDALHPLLWVEEGVELDGKLLSKVSQVFLIMKLMDAGAYFSMLASVAGMGFAGYLYNKNRKQVTITPVHQFQPSEDDNKTMDVVKNDEFNEMNKNLNKLNPKRLGKPANQGYDNPGLVED